MAAARLSMNEPSSARSSSGASCAKRRYLLSILSLGYSIAPNFFYRGRESSVLPRVDQRNHPSKDGVAGASADWHIFVSHVSISGDKLLRTPFSRTSENTPSRDCLEIPNGPHSASSRARRAGLKAASRRLALP